MVNGTGGMVNPGGVSPAQQYLDEAPRTVERPVNRERQQGLD